MAGNADPDSLTRPSNETSELALSINWSHFVAPYVTLDDGILQTRVILGFCWLGPCSTLFRLLIFPSLNGGGAGGCAAASLEFDESAKPRAGWIGSIWPQQWLRCRWQRSD